MENATAVQNTLPRLLYCDIHQQRYRALSQAKSANQGLHDGQPLLHRVGQIAFAFKKRLHDFCY